MRANFVKSARRDYPEAGIKKGESYWWWKSRYGPKQMSKTRPKESQLTNSEYLSTLLSIEEGIQAIMGTADFDDAIVALEEAEGELDNLRSECEDKVSNLESAFPGGCPSMELLQERADACDALMSEVQDAIQQLNDAKAEYEEELAILRADKGDEAEDKLEAEDELRDQAISAIEDALNSVDFSQAAIS